MLLTLIDCEVTIEYVWDALCVFTDLANIFNYVNDKLNNNIVRPDITEGDMNLYFNNAT